MDISNSFHTQSSCKTAFNAEAIKLKAKMEIEKVFLTPIFGETKFLWTFSWKKIHQYMGAFRQVANDPGQGKKNMQFKMHLVRNVYNFLLLQAE